MINKRGVLGEIAFVVIVVGIIVVFVLLFLPVKLFQTTDNGSHTGFVTAIERNGLFFKTYTVYFKSDVSSSQEDTYCVVDKVLISRLESYQKSKTKVTVRYEDYLFIGYPYCGNEEGLVVGVEE